MKIGIVLGTNAPEVAWNALRFGVTAKADGHDVRMFLLNSGVEIERIQDPKFDVPGQLSKFVNRGGQVLACGTCLDTRDMEASPVCPVSNMKELLDLVVASDRVVTFG
jgi:uncharacterized protein involved in oxidation of intracellular sulfur